MQGLFARAPEVRLAETAARAEAAATAGRLSEAVELRQECLAFAHLACRDDAFQLATAAALRWRSGGAGSGSDCPYRTTSY